MHSANRDEFLGETASMDADKPIRREEDDRLGFAPVAENLASVIVDRSASDGLVFGIEGKWGSGKSSLINLTIDAIRGRGNAAPAIIDFSPWLIGKRDALISTLFEELAIVASDIEPIEVTEDIASLGVIQRLKKRFLHKREPNRGVTRLTCGECGKQIMMGHAERLQIQTTRPRYR